MPPTTKPFMTAKEVAAWLPRPDYAAIGASARTRHSRPVSITAQPMPSITATASPAPMPDQPAGSALAIVGHNHAQDRPWANGGEFLAAVRSASVRLAAPKDPRLFASAAGAQETVDSEGGFAVPEGFGAGLMMRTYETGQVTSRCDTTPMGLPTLKLPRVDEKSRKDGQRQGGIAVYRAKEAAQYTESTTTMAVLELNANKLIGLTTLTEELYEDANAAALDKWVFQAFPREFSFRMDLEEIKGSGVGEFLGFQKSRATIVVAKDAGQASATVTASNIRAMWKRLWAGSRRTAAWFINPDLEDELMELTFVPNGGQPLYVPSGYMGNNTGYGTIMGCPVVPIEQAELPGVQGDFSLADMQEYLIGERSSQQVNSIHVNFLTGQNAFRWTVRNDGAPKWAEPVFPYNGTITRSPFVVLEARP